MPAINSASRRLGVTAVACRQISACPGLGSTNTGSRRAREILENWDEARTSFVKVLPLDFRRALLDLQSERRAAAE